MGVGPLRMTHFPPCRVLLIADADADKSARILDLLEPDAPPPTPEQLGRVANPESGLHAMRHNTHDVYLVDATQVGDTAGGFALLRRAEAEGCLRPAILLVEAADDRALGEALAAGAADCLPKSELNAFTLRRAVRWAVERDRAVRSLRESERLLGDFLENVPGAVFIKDLESRYLYVNKTGRDAFRLRVPADAWLGRSDAEIWPMVATALRAADLQVITSGQPAESVDVIDDGAGSPTHWQVHKFPVRDSAGRVRALGGVCLNITARVRADAAERERAQMLLGIAANVPVLAGRIDEHGTITEVIGTVRQGLNDAAFLRGRNVFQTWPENAAHVRRALAGEAVHLPWSGVLAGRVMHLDNHLFFDAEKGRGVIFFSRDVTERQQLQNQVLEISDAEQRRLGQDLHDGLGQHLAGLTYLTDALAHGLETRGAAEAAEARAIVNLLGEAMTQTRELARGLSPVDLKGGGLARALRNLAAGSEKIFGVRCELLIAPAVHPLLDAARNSQAVTHLYRIAQEATTNAARHGRARHLRIALEADPTMTQGTLTISDDGAGFPVASPPSPAAGSGSNDPSATPAGAGGLGLHMMDYRAGSLGGRLLVERNPDGAGMRVCCAFPLSGLSFAAPTGRD